MYALFFRHNGVDHFHMHEDYGDAIREWHGHLDDDKLECAGVGRVVEATEPHWIEPKPASIKEILTFANVLQHYSISLIDAEAFIRFCIAVDRELKSNVEPSALVRTLYNLVSNSKFELSVDPSAAPRIAAIVDELQELAA